MLRPDFSLIVRYCTVLRNLLIRFMMGSGSEMAGVVCNQECKNTRAFMALIGVTFS